MKALITGADGQLGRELVATAPSGTTVKAVTKAECNVAELSAVEKVLEHFAPEVVINTAAYTAVDAAEDNEAFASRVNAGGAENVATVSKRIGARLIHISTDYVFDGRSSTPYQPDAPTQPINVYGKTKLAGELAVRRETPDAVIIRGSWLYSTTGKNFLLRILELLQSDVSPRVVTDQRGSPTLATDLAEVVWLCSARTNVKGTYHFANAGDASWYEVAREIRRILVHDLEVTELPNIVPISSAEYRSRARRPAYSVLDSSALSHLLSHEARPWQEALRDAIGKLWQDLR